MARIKYIGPVNPMRIPGIGPISNEFIVVPDQIAKEFEKEDGFVTEFDKAPEVKNEHE